MDTPLYVVVPRSQPYWVVHTHTGTYYWGGRGSPPPLGAKYCVCMGIQCQIISVKFYFFDIYKLKTYNAWKKILLIKFERCRCVQLIFCISVDLSVTFSMDCFFLSNHHRERSTQCDM